jgi:hypothetical protein
MAKPAKPKPPTSTKPSPSRPMPKKVPKKGKIVLDDRNA